mgnify:FL=1
MEVGNLVRRSDPVYDKGVGLVLDVAEMTDGHMYYEVRWYGTPSWEEPVGWYDSLELKTIKEVK